MLVKFALFTSIFYASLVIATPGAVEAQRVRSERAKLLRIASTNISLEEFNTRVALAKIGSEAKPAKNRYLNLKFPAQIDETVRYSGYLGVYFPIVIDIKTAPNSKTYILKFEDGSEVEAQRADFQKRISSYRDLNVNDHVVDNAGYEGSIVEIVDNGNIQVVYNNYPNRWYMRTSNQLIKIKK